MNYLPLFTMKGLLSATMNTQLLTATDDCLLVIPKNLPFATMNDLLCITIRKLLIATTHNLRFLLLVMSTDLKLLKLLKVIGRICLVRRSLPLTQL